MCAATHCNVAKEVLQRTLMCKDTRKMWQIPFKERQTQKMDGRQINIGVALAKIVCKGGGGTELTYMGGILARLVAYSLAGTSGIALCYNTTSTLSTMQLQDTA